MSLGANCCVQIMLGLPNNNIAGKANSVLDSKDTLKEFYNIFGDAERSVFDEMGKNDTVKHVICFINFMVMICLIF